MKDSSPVSPRPGGLSWPWRILAIGVLLLLLFCLALGPMGHGRGFIYKQECTQKAHIIALMIYQYVNDHLDDPHPYPDGHSSTEVFQQLIDGKYCADPAIFYVPMQGKTSPIPGQKLKPENVCWDITSGVAPTDSDELPLVFMTGYKMNYAPDAAAIPLIRPYPPYTESWGSWLEFNGMHESIPIPGLAVATKNLSATFKPMAYPVYRHGDVLVEDHTRYAPDAVVPHVVPEKFDPKGRTWVQLTPDGPLR